MKKIFAVSILIVSVGCSGTFGGGGSPRTSPSGAAFKASTGNNPASLWTNYARAYCGDISQRMSLLEDQLRKSDARKTSGGAVVTGVLALAGTLVTAALVNDQEVSDDKTKVNGKTATIVSASITGGTTVVGAITTLLLGGGNDDLVKLVKEKRSSIETDLNAFEGDCPFTIMNDPDKGKIAVCNSKAYVLATRCESKRIAATLAEADDLQLPSEFFESHPLPESVSAPPQVPAPVPPNTTGRGNP